MITGGGTGPKQDYQEEVGTRQHDVYSVYETGLYHLLNQMKSDHPRYSEALLYQLRLRENIARSRRHGDTDTRKAERFEIIEQINGLSLSVLGISFSELCSPITPITRKEPAKRLLEQLYATTRQAEADNDWSQAIDLLQQILAIDRNYKDASQKLTNAKKEERLAELYSQGMACFRNGDWAETIRLLQLALEIDQDYKDASQRLLQAKKQERLEQLYARVKQAEANHDWQLMITVCREIIGIAPLYRDVQRLLWKARSHSTRRSMRAVWANYKTIISMLAILLMGAGIVVLGKSAPEVSLPTLTPPTPQVSVNAFLVTKEGGPPSTAESGTTITARVEEVVQIKVEVSMTDEVQEEDLVFTWYTCRTENGPVLQRVGNPAMLYVTPSEPGPDCICVVVEKGGVQLDKQEIFVNVQE